MTQPFVSSYDEAFMEAFDRGMKEMPSDLNDAVKVMVDKLHDDVLTRLHDYVVDDMKSNIDGAIRDHASKVAESMLANALAGDSKEIRNLFGFNEWYTKHLYLGDGPTQWKLIDALIERRPDLFVDERIKQREAEILNLNQTVERLKQRIEYMQENYIAP